MNELEKEKNKLDKMILHGCSENKLLKQSQKVDKLIVKFYKEQQRLEKKYNMKFNLLGK